MRRQMSDRQIADAVRAAMREERGDVPLAQAGPDGCGCNVWLLGLIVLAAMAIALGLGDGYNERATGGYICRETLWGDVRCR